MTEQLSTRLSVLFVLGISDLTSNRRNRKEREREITKKRKYTRTPLRARAAKGDLEEAKEGMGVRSL